MNLQICKKCYGQDFKIEITGSWIWVSGKDRGCLLWSDGDLDGIKNDKDKLENRLKKIKVSKTAKDKCDFYVEQIVFEENVYKRTIDKQ